MNKQDRKNIQRALPLLEEAKNIIDELASEERDKFDNMPENLQDSEAGQKFDWSAEVLETANENIESAISELEDLA